MTDFYLNVCLLSVEGMLDQKLPGGNGIGFFKGAPVKTALHKMVRRGRT